VYTPARSHTHLYASRSAGADWQFEQLSPPYMPDSWELAAWKTSSHSLKPTFILQQQQQGMGDLGSAAADSGPASTSGSHMPLSKQLSSHELILQGTGLSTSQAMLAGNKISLGVCIGAGLWAVR
jgi:hypothetical protein